MAEADLPHDDDAPRRYEKGDVFTAYDMIARSLNVNIQKTGIIVGFAALVFSVIIVFIYDKSYLVSSDVWSIPPTLYTVIGLLITCCVIGLISLSINVLKYDKGDDRGTKPIGDLAHSSIAKALKYDRKKFKDEWARISLENVACGSIFEIEKAYRRCRILNTRILNFLLIMYLMLGLSIVLMIPTIFLV